jgi:amino acid adenylation domain-containing protein
MSNSRESFSDLTPSQRDLLRLKLAAIKRNGGERVDQAPPQARSETAPLSYAQRRVWFFTQLAPETSAYNIVQGRRLTGRLNPVLLEQSVNETVRRHDALRTVFQSQNGEPVQAITAATTIAIRMIDLQSLSRLESEGILNRLSIEDAGRFFDLAQGPLVRITVLKLGAREHVMLITLHHIIADFESLGILTSEMALLHAIFLKGEPSTLPELKAQYVDYAVWEREWMRGKSRETQLAFWRDRLQEPPPGIDLALDGLRPRAGDLSGEARAIVLPAALYESIRTLSQREGCTLTMTLLAGFLALIHRLTRQEDLALGMTIANRDRAEFEPLVGFFVNTLTLRADLSGEPDFITLLQRVRGYCLDAYSARNLPFDKLVEELRPERQPNRHPFFDILFNSMRVPSGETGPSGLGVANFERPDPESKFALTFNVEEYRDRIGVRAVYQRAIFSGLRIECLLNQYHRLLEQVVADPLKSIEQYSLVALEDQAWSMDPAARLDEPAYDSVIERFWYWVQKSPSRPAITQETMVWTYADAGVAVSRLVARLRDEGAAKGAVIAVTGERSFGLIVGMISALGVGGVLTPLDQQLPPERKRLLLREAKADYVIHVGRPDDNSWLVDAGTRALIVEPDFAMTPGKARIDEHHLRTPIAPAPDDPAYLFCTSGTTGRIKMVLGVQKGLSHFLDWQRREFQIEPADRCAQLTGFSFDVVLRDVFLPLTSGAALCLPPGTAPLSPDRVLAWLEQERITLLHAVPALAQAWMKGAPEGISLRSLRWIFFAGEPLTDALIRRWREKFPGATGIINLYGPTETTLAKCWHRVLQDPQPGVQPIGRPLPQTQVLILTDDRRLCGVGEPGQIAIRTPFRTLGYLNAEEETRRRFIPNPFTDNAGDAIYLTGDNGRYRLNGEVEILGRSDHQLKIRGVRIEPDEISGILADHPAVASSVVVPRKDERGELTLVAYLSTYSEARATVEELRAYVSRRLPAAMTPSAFVILERLPLTLNGKVDRQALPAPDPSSFGVSQAYIAPRTSVEKELAKIWARSLEADRVGVDDNFFSLGGHSLSATRVIAAIRDAFQLEVPLYKLFESPTISELAEWIEALRRKPAADSYSVSPSRTESEQRLYPLTYSQQRLWLLDQLTPGNAAYNLPKALELSGSLLTAALDQGLVEIFRRHEICCARFIERDGAPYQTASPASTLQLHYVDLGGLEIQTALDLSKRLIDDQALRPFDLSRDVLFRARLFRLSPDRHRLLTELHHIISDLWSMEVLVGELSSFYETHRQGVPSRFPELAFQFMEFARRQRDRLQGKVLEEHLHYWTERLSAAPATLDLPTDRRRPTTQSFRGARLISRLAPSLTLQLKSLCRREQVTSYMAMLAGFQALLGRYAGQNDFVVGSPITDRSGTETEAMIGFFVNMLALRADLSGAPDFRTLLDRVKSTTMGAFAHQDLPFERLVEELQPDRRLSHTPLFQIAFAFHRLPETAPPLTDLEGRFIEVETGTSKFDLTLHIIEDGAEMTALFEYGADLFDRATIVRMQEQFSTLLEAASIAPTQCVCELPLLRDHERVQTLVEWNDTERRIDNRCLHELFDDQAERRPDAVAVSCGSMFLSYAALRRESKFLSARLKQRGVSAGDYVGVGTERTPAMIVGALGVLRAGGAYVPLDLSYPSGRLRAMIDDAQVKVVLLSESESDREKQWFGNAKILMVQSQPSSEGEEIDSERPIDWNNAAYINYTSGSTGQAKGVAVPHRAVVRLLASIDYARLDEHKRILHLSPLSFDASTFEIWGALLHGGQCVLLPESTPTLEDIGRATLDHSVTTMWLTASLFNLIIDEAPQVLSGVEQLLVGGEALSTRHVQKALRLLPETDLINGYGPTEGTTFSCCCSLDRSLLDQDRSAPIGRPIANTQVFVLNEQMQPCPIGVPGELYIGGDGLALGYLNQTILTAEKFIPRPFGDSPGARLYRSGDRVRYLPEGRIEFLGRTDSQVKVRGFRIDLREIEAALETHESVEKAVVIVREDRPGDKKLVAYFTSAIGSGEDASSLRRFLAGALPSYMIPGAYLELSAFPLTATGKIDRKSLPAPDQSPDAVAAGVSPRNEREAAIAGIWKDVLGVERIGVHDNFFDLGGHSLLLVKVNRRLRELVRRDLPMVEMFRHPTISGLASFLEREDDQSPTYEQRRHRALTRRESLTRRRRFKQDLSAANSQQGYDDHEEAG